MDLLKTPLYEWHVAQGARMVEFAGWRMRSSTPRSSTSTVPREMPAGLRTSRTWAGCDSRGRAPSISWRPCSRAAWVILRLGQIRYSLVTNDNGGILDDVLVGYYHNEYGQPFYVVVVNASNREKIVRWTGDHLSREVAEARGEEIVWADVTRLWAMFAVQGPRAIEVLQPIIDEDLSAMRYYKGQQVRILHPAARRQGAIISRTGYTGEDGFELALGASIAREVWDVLLELGRPHGMIPTGLGARDTLRLEAGMPLYGHELSEEIDPFQPDWDRPAI